MKCNTSSSLIHTLLFFVRPERAGVDFEKVARAMYSLEKGDYKKVVVYNQGPLTNEQCYLYFQNFKELDVDIIGTGENVGILKGRQACFEYVWETYKEVQYISELHIDMVFTKGWENILLDYLEKNEDEPVISCGIVDKNGYIPVLDQWVTSPEQRIEEIDDFLNQLKKDEIGIGYTHPCIHRSEVLKKIGGINLRILSGRQAFEDDSILLGYHYYLGTRKKWRPKINFNAMVYHEVAGQRLELNDNIWLNLEKLIKQYGIMGLKVLSELHGTNGSIALFKLMYERHLNE